MLVISFKLEMGSVGGGKTVVAVLKRIGMSQYELAIRVPEFR